MKQAFGLVAAVAALGWTAVRFAVAGSKARRRLQSHEAELDEAAHVLVSECRDALTIALSAVFVSAAFVFHDEPGFLPNGLLGLLGMLLLVVAIRFVRMPTWQERFYARMLGLDTAGVEDAHR